MNSFIFFFRKWFQPLFNPQGICQWHRQIMANNGRELTLDAPITSTIESRWGGAKAIVYEQAGLLSESGVENLSLESDYDKTLPMDESHCWDGVYIADAENCWVRMVNFRHFAGSAVVIQKSAQQITIEDCQSFDPISEIGGLRRRTFLTFGEKILFQRCYSEHGINDFAVGHTAPGPNAFVQCDSYESFGPSGAISSWAPGILFDIVNIDGNDIVTLMAMTLCLRIGSWRNSVLDGAQQTAPCGNQQLLDFSAIHLTR